MSALSLLWDKTFGWNPYDPAKLKQRDDGIEPIVIEESRVRRSSVWIVIFAFIAFFAWSVTAPLDAGVVMTGSVTVSGNRKSVQPPGGGVVQALMVKEGSVVKQGDVVLKINPLNSEANLTSAELQYINLLATESRLLTERMGEAEIRWRPELNRFGAKDPRVAEAKMIQQQLPTNINKPFYIKPHHIESITNHHNSIKDEVLNTHYFSHHNKDFDKKKDVNDKEMCIDLV